MAGLAGWRRAGLQALRLTSILPDDSDVSKRKADFQDLRRAGKNAIGRTLRRFPRIDDRDARLVVIASITRNNRKAVVNSSGGDNQVWLGERMASLSAFLDQQSPLEHDVFGNLENPMVEHRAHLVCEPVIQLGAAVWIVNKLDAKTYFSKGYGADVKLIKRASGDKIDDPRFRLRAAQFGQDIGIEKPRHQNVTPLTGERSLVGSRSISR